LFLVLSKECRLGIDKHRVLTKIERKKKEGKVSKVSNRTRGKGLRRKYIVTDFCRLC
jgi:hypothetical protein